MEKESTFKLLKAKEKLSKEVVDSKLKPEEYGKLFEMSEYKIPDKAKDTYQMILRHFQLGDTNMQTPRVEFNDMSVLQRDQIDQMAWNTYQPNNGQAPEADEINGWRSRAVRPIIRNKCISIAAHATARLIFPKVFAFNNQSQAQQDAARVMEDLMEWAADQSNYAFTSLLRTITAMYSPASIGYTEYAEAYRIVRRPDGNGGYTEERILDENLSGFQDTVVPVQELYIENFFEHDIQKQGWVIWRRVQSYSLLEAKYAQIYPNFKYVKPGVQNVYNDANNTFYQVYDPNMRQEDGEEIIYWNRNLDLKIIMVNGVMLTDHKNPNPRNDKQFPFDKFGYELINNKCFYYKSLAFKLGPDADIINTLYPMIIDGTYLNLMPPMINVGGEIIGSDVIVPGAVTTLSAPNADLRAVNIGTNLKAGMDTMFKVDESINASSEDPIQSGQSSEVPSTAYALSRLEQNAATVLGLFIKMISDHVRSFGKLRLSDILQYLTIADVDATLDNPELIYKTFFMGEKASKGKTKNRRIVFDGSLSSEPRDTQTELEESYQVLEEQGGEESDEELYKVNPELYRKLKFMLSVSPDVMNPMSEDLERAYALETFDRAIALPNTDHDELTRDLLLGTSPVTKKNPDKYMMKQEDMMAMMQQQATEQPGTTGTTPPSPIQAATNPQRQLSQMPAMAK